MERLTYYSMKGSEYDGYYLLPCISQKEANQKLGEYESTEKSPAEIVKMQEEIAELKIKVEEYKRFENEVKSKGLDNESWCCDCNQIDQLRTEYKRLEKALESAIVPKLSEMS